MRNYLFKLGAEGSGKCLLFSRVCNYFASDMGTVRCLGCPGSAEMLEGSESADETMPASDETDASDEADEAAEEESTEDDEETAE